MVPAEWGGEFEFVDVSAKTRAGLDRLLGSTAQRLVRREVPLLIAVSVLTLVLAAVIVTWVFAGLALLARLWPRGSPAES